MKNDPCSCAGFLVSIWKYQMQWFSWRTCTVCAAGKMEKTIFKLKKTISCVNYWTSHVKQPDVASSVRPGTKPLVVNAISAIICIRSLKKIQDFNGVWDFKPCWTPEFISDFLCNCINSIHKSEDHSSFDNKFCCPFILPCITCFHTFF